MRLSISDILSMAVVCLATASAMPAAHADNSIRPTKDTCPSAPGDIDSGKVLSYLGKVALKRSKKYVSGACKPHKIQYRQEWRTLPKQKQLQYIKAAKCVQSTPSVFPDGVVPGSTSLYEDFVAVHINQTLNIHLTATFLIWHRYFAWAYEQQIHKCGYPGALPYWDWPRDVDNLEKSPIFDGSETSMSGNGDYVPHEGIIITQPGGNNGKVYLEPGTGGGCVTTGPFANMTVRLGPANLPVYGKANITKVSNPLENNPRCLRRDLSSSTAKRFDSFRIVTEMITKSDNIEWFQAIMQGDPRYVSGSLGPHGGGHFQMGGDPGSDPFVSPNDPAFYLHHSQVDRLYWIWQNLDFPNRQDVYGTQTFYDLPPSNNVTVNDLIDISPLPWKPVTIKSIMNTVGGTPLCYAYV